MHLLRRTVLLLIALSASCTSHAPTGLGTTKGGATGQVAAAIAKVVSTRGDLQIRTQPMAGSKQYIPLVNAGRLEFGVANLPQVAFAVQGQSLFEGHPHSNLRMVATLMRWRVGVVVADNSDIQSVGDLRGLPVPSGFRAAPLFKVLMDGFLATDGLSYDDVTQVPVASLAQSWELFMQEKVLAAVFAVGTGALSQADIALGGVRFLSLTDSPEALARMQQHVPRSYLRLVEPDPKLTGVTAPSRLMGYDYTLFTGKDVAEDLVYEVTRLMYESIQELRTTGALWSEYVAERMPKDVGLEYHPGAVKFYEEIGLWESESS